MKRRLDLLLLLPLCALLAWWQWRYVGYVKDDAYISLRYARNLSEGLGLVFNPGEKLEGYTNFLWILLAVPAFWLKVDPLTWVKALGCLFGQLGILVSYETARFLGGGRSDGWPYLAAVLWATSTSVVLWSMGGLEPTMMAVTCSGGTLLAMRAVAAEEPGEARRWAVGSALLLAAAALTRPDAHAVAILAGGAVAAHALVRRRWDRVWWLWAGLLVGILGPYHLFRVLYFGDLLPNTFYVKAAAGPEVWAEGRKYVLSLLGFNANPAVFALAPLALLARERRAASLWGLALVAAFLLYLVKIGRDEMKYFRLFLPVYPVALALAAVGAKALLEGAVRLGARAAGRPEAPRAALVGALAVGLLAAGAGGKLSVDTTSSKQAWNSNFVRWSENSFQALGRHVAERSEPGAVAVFQDMGGAPWAGGELRWIDTIGILNRFVARELAAIELNPFMRSERMSLPGGREAVRAFDERVRDYCFEQDPEWIAFVAYVPKSRRRAFERSVKAARGDAAKLESLFMPYLKRNTHAHGIAADSRFSDFRWERHWMRNSGYWLVLYRRAG